ncbi:MULTISPECIES: cation:proton antiporter [Leptolyngbya]|nr:MULTISPECIES: sodium:proton antiporter [Leptolyngbya]MBD2369002.1 sodium:proton antiporter [Leptolyngbya sp. FACHB-161]MBD2375790.1 sodium:proton antiporter [Leptolyngbya sp. FACHB-238]MBD2399904.1 sodium:proton antiporter [Leptolyngbya sp. FACHB-239]MBD2406110.1 sodium:proton antiporter [Leptolyngbya sp. FACHB-402]ULP28061.1 sodium:proton antiporter [Leptolyngbya boryana IU 594]
MEDSLTLTVLISTTVGVGIGAQVIARYLQIPSIVFLLLLGLALGSSGLRWIDPSLLGSGLEVIVSLSIAIILFEGGLSLQIRDLRSVSISLRNLITIGVAITLVGGAIAAHTWLDFPWSIAFLYASLVVVTGPTVVTPLLKLVGVERRVATLLEGEGILIDPIGAILAVITLNIVLSGKAVPLVLSNTAIPLLILKGLLLRLGIGVAIGLIFGSLLSLLLKQSKILPQELKNLIVLAVVWGSFSLAQALRSESGLLAVVIIGIVLRAAATPDERLLRQFNEQLGILTNSVLFILLAADLSIEQLFDLGQEGVIVVLALMLIVRPINVLISTWNRGFSWQQQFFLSWVAPRGIVAASMASLFAISLSNQGMSGGDALKALVFLTILITVFVQGVTAGWIARWLGLHTNQVRTVIVGGDSFARLLSRLLQQKGEAAMLIDFDVNTTNLEPIDENPALSDRLNLEELEAEGISSFSSFLALSSSPEVNGILAQRAAELFRPDLIAILSPSPLGDGNSLSAITPGIQAAFAPQIPLDQWNQWLDQDEAQVVEIVLRSPTLAAQQAELQTLIASNNLMPLIVERNQEVRIVISNEEWQAGDRITCLLHKSADAMISLEKSPFVKVALNTSEWQMVAKTN